ncbi:hypothetical protein [Haladaptatus sp. CMSO5]|uniref:hypothetical protein n=1 Tax=Haladaptatus sp. CMSO5 TaxID=3120514 RepID=UPI002FCE357D
MTDTPTSRRTLLKRGALIAGAASLGIPGTVGAQEEQNAVCARSPGYWGSHPDAWPVDELQISNKRAPKEFWISYLLNRATDGDKNRILAKALVAAKLNQYAGAEDACIRYRGTADDCIGGGICHYGVPGVAVRWLYAAGFAKFGTPAYEPMDSWYTDITLPDECTGEWVTKHANGECLYDTLDAYNNGELCACAAEEALEGARFELTAFEAPEEVELGAAFIYSFTVENTGGETGTVETEIATSVAEWYVYPSSPVTWTATLDAGESRTFESDPLKLWWEAPFSISLSAFNQSRDVRTTRPVMAFGEAFVTGHDVRFSVNAFEHVPDPSNPVTHVEITCENQTDEAAPIPDMGFLWLYSNGSYRYVDYGNQPPVFYGELAGNETRTETITYEVEQSFDAADVTVGWEDEDPIGSIGAYWSNNPSNIS